MQKKPNLLFIFADELRFDTLGYAGHPLVKTPNIDALAEQSHNMQNSYCVTPLCVPSRVSFFTGKYPHRSGSTFFHYKDYVHPQMGSLVEPLKENGYKMGVVGKNHAFADDYMDEWVDFREIYGSCGKEQGVLTARDREVIAWRSDEKRPQFKNVDRLQEGLIEEPEPFAQEDCVTHRIAQDSMDFVQQCGGDPFCLYMSFPDPHWPNVVCEPYYSMYDPRDITDLDALEIDWESRPFKHYVQSQVNGYDDYTLEQRKQILATVMGQITFIDAAVGLLIDKLKELNQFDNTLIVFTADHGNFTGRYGLVGKTLGFHDVLMRTPCLIKMPDQGGARAQAAQVSNIDIIPTVYDYCGMELDSKVQGESFLKVLNGQASEHRDVIFGECGCVQHPPEPMSIEDFRAVSKERSEEDPRWFLDYTINGRSAMIRKDGWKYVYYTGDSEELYDLNTDPREERNRAGEAAFGAQKERLKNELMEWLLASSVS